MAGLEQNLVATRLHYLVAGTWMVVGMCEWYVGEWDSISIPERTSSSSSLSAISVTHPEQRTLVFMRSKQQQEKGDHQ